MRKIDQDNSTAVDSDFSKIDSHLTDLKSIE